MKLAALLNGQTDSSTLARALATLPHAPSGLTPRLTVKLGDFRRDIDRESDLGKEQLEFIADALLALTPTDLERDLAPIEFADLCTLIIKLREYEILDLNRMWPFMWPGSFRLVEMPQQ